MNKKVLIVTRSFGKTSNLPFQKLADAGCEAIRIDPESASIDQELFAILTEIDAIIVGLVPIHADMIKHSPKLKIISMHGVGVNHIDLNAAQDAGIIVANCPGSNDQAVADLTLGLMLTVARNIHCIDRDIRGGKWGRYLGGELWQKKLGLIGLGNIAQGVAQRAKGFKMQISAYDPYIDQEDVEKCGVTLRSLEEILADSDFVSLHLPLTDETRSMISSPQLDLMKTSSYLINTARGGIVDEDALYKALHNGQIAGAGLDVFEEEPLNNSKLIELDNVVLTAHTGTHTRESIDRMSLMAVDNVLRVFEYEEPINRIV